MAASAAADRSCTAGKQPALFLAHGGGPLPLLGDPSHASLVESLKEVPKVLPGPPKAILLISAHWEEREPRVTAGEQPPLIYDYYNFPPESYKITYPAPGDPALARRVVDLLRQSGFPAQLDTERGFDHGAFVPLKVAFPEATIPLLQLSLMSNLNPKEHIRMGEALAPLRQEGVLIVGSGMTFHNMRAFGLRGAASGASESLAFDEYLRERLAGPGASAASQREALENWAAAPHARFCHPREEHLLPLHVAAGAALGSPARVIFSDLLLGQQCSSFLFTA